MGTSTVNIAFKNDLLLQIDSIAREESRTRSELVRENVYRAQTEMEKHLRLRQR